MPLKHEGAQQHTIGQMSRHLYCSTPSNICSGLEHHVTDVHAVARRSKHDQVQQGTSSYDVDLEDRSMANALITIPAPPGSLL